MTERGKYIVIEGGDGTGKSTQVEILQKRLLEHGIKSIQIHEPDGFKGDASLGIPSVPAATELRKRIKDATITRTPWENVQMFTEARKLNWLEAMNPALEQGIWVLAARSWISTVAYQGYGEGIDIEKIRDYTLGQVGRDYLSPDLTLILTINDEKARFDRIAKRGELEKPDTFESKPDSFQKAMQTGYDKFAADFDIKTIDASGSIESISGEIWRQVKPLLSQEGE